MNLEKIALKPCPFCGSAGMFENARGSYGYYPEKLRVRCSDAGCSGQTGWFIHGEKAANAWNSRAAQAALTAMLEGFGGDGVTEGDRSAASSLFRDERTDLAVKFRLGQNPAPLLEAFARHRQLSAAAERARIVAWLREQDGYGEWQEAADAIERSDI